VTLPAADCHAHVFCPGRYTFAADATYTPHPVQQGTAAGFAAVLDAHAITHGLLVAAEPYMTDNRCMLDAIAEHPDRFKGIALVSPDIADRDLDVLAARSVVGIRYNLSSFGMRQFVHPATTRLFARLKELGWFLQIHCEKDELAEALPILRRTGVRAMIDHFGRPDPRRGVGQPGFAALLELGRSTDAVVKLSAPYRASIAGYPFHDVDPFIAAAIDAFTLDRCVWGSDWPFVRHDARMDYGPQLACLARWLPTEGDRQTILWANPERLFGFRPLARADD
jgi:predicted TIM-barrel fold metal-dependent hydrolase